LARVGDELGYARNLPLRYRREAIPYIALALLLAVGLVLTLSPMMYQSVEKIETVLVSIILGIRAPDTPCGCGTERAAKPCVSSLRVIFSL
jgi:hypothetical protein